MESIMKILSAGWFKTILEFMHTFLITHISHEVVEDLSYLK